MRHETGRKDPELAALLLNLPVPSVLIDSAGVALAYNAAAAELLGWEESAGDAARRMLGTESAILERLRAVAEEEGHAIPIRWRDAAGRHRYVKVRARKVVDDTGGVVGLLLTLADQTGEVRMRRALRRSRQRFMEAVDAYPEPVLIHDLEEIRYVNPAALRLFGAKRADDLVHRRWIDLIHEDSHDIARERMRDIVETGGPIETAVQLVRLDGAVLDVVVTGRRVHHGVFQAVLRDVTERKRVEEGLRASQLRFRLLSEGVRDHAIIMLDPAGHIASWNVGAERLTGYQAHEAIRQHIALLYPPEACAAGEPVEHIEAADAAGRIEEEGWRLRKDGSKYWASASIAALRGAAGEHLGYATIVRDLTERKDQEDALRRSETQLRQAQKMEAIGRLAGGIAHDFNNLLTAIQGHAQFLIEDLPASEPARGDALEIKRAADRAATLTRQLLTFSRRQTVQRQVLQLNDVITEMEKLLRRLIREDIALIAELEDDLWETFADRGQMEQVIMNLVVNARDAMPSGGALTVATHNLLVDEDYAIPEVSLEAGPYVQLVVSDTGVGMDKETLGRIFEPFFTTKSEGHGTGLGLATVYGIVKQSGGHITAYSEPGRGTTFKVFLPRDRGHSPADTVPRAPVDDAREGDTVLLVEDDAAVRSLASRILRKRGYTILEANNGREALDLARDYDGPIDVVVTDVVMPEMSGRRLAADITTLKPGTAVIHMSGFTRADALRQGLVDPSAIYIEKPFSPDALLGAVREVLHKKR